MKQYLGGKERSSMDGVVEYMSNSKRCRFSLNLMDLSDHCIMEVIDRMDSWTKGNFALSCTRFERLSKYCHGHMQMASVELKLRREYRLNSTRIESGRGVKAPRNAFTMMIGHNLTGLTLRNVVILDDVRYSVHFDKLRFISLELCKFQNFNYLWNACKNSLEYLIVDSTYICEPYHYEFDKLNKVEISSFNYSVKDGSNKLLFSLNPSIKTATIRSFNKDIIKDIYKSNIEHFSITNLTADSHFGFGSCDEDLIDVPIKLKYVCISRNYLYRWDRPVDVQRWLLDLCHNGVRRFCLNDVIFNKTKFQIYFPGVDFGNKYLDGEYDEWPTLFVQKHYDKKYL
jgi:hypothetical protein